MQYSIGIDFGTSSGRVFLVEVETGHVSAQCEISYAHGTLTQNFEGQPLPDYCALQHAGDYWDVLQRGIKHVLQETGIAPEAVIGIGVDFTASTVVFVDDTMTPLHLRPDFEHNPNAYVRLWKDHSAEDQAQYIRKVAQENEAQWLGHYGHNVSSEWTIPKILKVYEDAPEVIEASAAIMQAGDWIVNRLIGKHVLSNCGIGFKTFWDASAGFYYDLFERIHPALPNIVKEKVAAPVVSIGEIAGYLTPDVAEALGLTTQTAVSPFMIDAHASVLGVGAQEARAVTMVVGTSTCHLMLHQEARDVTGISGYVKDAIIPGVYAYEAGQPAVGDLLAYAVEQAPKALVDEAQHQQVSVYDLLNDKAARFEPGETGLMVLDWHNGSRSVLNEGHLSGVVVGLTLNTPHEAVYRAYIEATAYGARHILSQFHKAGLTIDTVYACGGIPQKNKFMMQIYANVLNQTLTICDHDNAPALGAAILGAFAGGAYETLESAVDAMSANTLYCVHPEPEHVAKYETLYQTYRQMQTYYSATAPEIMRTLHTLKGEEV